MIIENVELVIEFVLIEGMSFDFLTCFVHRLFFSHMNIQNLKNGVARCAPTTNIIHW